MKSLQFATEKAAVSFTHSILICILNQTFTLASSNKQVCSQILNLHSYLTKCKCVSHRTAKCCHCQCLTTKIPWIHQKYILQNQNPKVLTKFLSVSFQSPNMSSHIFELLWDTFDVLSIGTKTSKNQSHTHTQHTYMLTAVVTIGKWQVFCTGPTSRVSSMVSQTRK